MIPLAIEAGLLLFTIENRTESMDLLLPIYLLLIPVFPPVRPT
jgi:hypothetical protein